MLLVTGISGTDNRCKKGYIATCDCGKVRSYTFGGLVGKSFQSCGCLKRSNRGKIIRRDVNKFDTDVKAGNTNPLYSIFSGAWGRCNNEKSAAFKHYGSMVYSFCGHPLNSSVKTWVQGQKVIVLKG